MPELPEVEVLRMSLRPHLQGRRVEGVRVWNSSLREPVDSEMLDRRIVGKRIRDLERRAKYLIVRMQTPDALLVHLGMSGRLTLAAGNSERRKHDHVEFRLDDDRKLVFHDPRRFGLIHALDGAEITSDRHLCNLGLEPLGEGFDGESLLALARGRRGPVKSFLMNGNLVAGVGNIYASEVMHRVGLHPRRSVARIAAPRWNDLAVAIRATLEQAVREGGTTLNDFADGEGRPGYFQVSLGVYGREGEPCGRCGRPIRRIVQTGRSTFYCPGCQH